MTTAFKIASNAFLHHQLLSTLARSSMTTLVSWKDYMTTTTVLTPFATQKTVVPSPPAKQWRDGRGSYQNIPAFTGAAKAGEQGHP